MKPTAICSECGKEFVIGRFAKTCGPECSNARKLSLERGRRHLNQSQAVDGDVMVNVELAKVGRCPGVISNEEKAMRSSQCSYKDATDIRTHKLVFRSILILLTTAPLLLADQVDRLLDAIQVVESGGGPGPYKRGDGGRARGAYQIWASYAKDAGYKWSDADTVAVSRKIVRAYWLRYAKPELSRGDLKGLALCHHLGPSFRTRVRNDGYWGKVQRAMKGK